MTKATREQYIACANAGMSGLEASRALGVSAPAVCLAARRIGIAFADGRKTTEFAKASAERMRERHKDPEFVKANAERMRERHKDPEYNQLAALTPSQRADYDTLKKAGYTRDEAFRAIGVAQ